MKHKIEKQKRYIKAAQNVEAECPYCLTLVNINLVLERENTCPKCNALVKYNLGFFGGTQWLEKR